MVCTCLDISASFFALLISQPGPRLSLEIIFSEFFLLTFPFLKSSFPRGTIKLSFVNDWLPGSRMPNVVSSFLTVMTLTSLTLVAFK